ncbi:FBD domain-containing protein [Heracleum sosnowskyi]|uniref:FBD domain-containing protein n=1 Tax=Heracleum sosnowskyi TaxID=360622 RepID=A0AAD8M116_9APIA|nr:FBD domain-containing protein [Heracleum sosnowskyi]
MAESSTRKVGGIRNDRISVLPRNILEIILCFLPIRDAVRTSVLSRSWRHCWTTVPNLVFNESIISPNSYDFSECHHRELKALKFVSVINKVLLLHNGPILKFSLNFPEYHCNAKIIHNYIDQWIPLFSRKGIKHLTLVDSLPGVFVALNFSSLKLTHLRLANFRFPYTPAFGGLTYLRNLELIEVTTSGQSIFDCPVLEKLTLIASEDLSHTNFRAPNLKCLHQHSREVILEYSLAGLENITEYSFRLSEDLIPQPQTPSVVNVLSSLQKIEKLSIAKYFIRYLAAGGSPNRLSKLLPCLKTLSIFDIDYTRVSEISCLLCLIRSAPNLCKLHISAEFGAFYQAEFGVKEMNHKDNWEEDFEDCTVDHLQIVTFSHFQGLKAELELVKFLLAHSPLLKTMFIHRNCFMPMDLAFEVAEEMLEFSRASSRAQVKNLECPFDAVDYGPWVNRLNLYADE